MPAASGSAGNLVKPAAPKSPKEAAKATPGEKTEQQSAKQEHKPDENPDKTSWIEYEVVYESNSKPVPGLRYQVTLPDGETVATGILDNKGCARIKNIDPGTCKFSLIDLDGEAWDKA